MKAMCSCKRHVISCTETLQHNNSLLVDVVVESATSTDAPTEKNRKHSISKHEVLGCNDITNLDL